MKETVELNLYWGFEHTVSNNFNRLKAKAFNLIEATTTNEQQAQAIKGLIRGFANEEYRLCVEDMRQNAVAAGLITQLEADSCPPMLAGPLDTKN